MYPDVETQGIEKAYIGAGANIASSRQTKRQRLLSQRAVLAHKLEQVDKALSALDAHPELEEFIETLQNAEF